MDTAVARGLRESAVAELLEEETRLPGHPRRIGEAGAGLRVEVDTELVRVVGVVASNRPWVEDDRADLRRPGDDRRFGRADLVGGPPGRKRDRCGLDEVRS